MYTFSSLAVTALASSGANLFAGTDGSGVSRRPVSDMIVSVEDLPTVMREHFTLEQNYPNPFNPTTTITYRLPAAGHVTLTVFDVLGRKVAALVNDVKQAASYSVQWDASGAASGVYYYQLAA